MHTVIGQCLSSSRRSLAIATAIAVFVVVADFALILWEYYPHSIKGRGVLAIIGLVAFFWLVNGDLDSVGLRLKPVQGWWYWFRISLLIGLIILAIMLLMGGVWVLTGRDLPVYTTQPHNIVPSVLWFCLFTPVLEEVTYRLVLCMPLAVLVGPRWTIVASGLVFGGLHVAYGTPSPTNFLGGFVLTWAYLKSGSIAVPVILHSLGNLFVRLASIGAWYWLNGGF